MNFEFRCPQCGLTVETDEANRGQVAACPHCGKGIVVPRGAAELSVQRNVVGTPRQKSVRTAFPQGRQMAQTRPGNGLQAVCPQCGTQYEVDKKDLNRCITCGTCGNRFIVGAMNILHEKSAYDFRAERIGYAQPRMAMPCSSGNVEKKVPGWRCFVAWLAYSVVSLLTTILVCFVVGAIVGAVLGANGVSMSKIVDTCGSIGAVLGPIVSMPIGYFSFRYVAITIINRGK